jgi:ADP-heptose:LPS heptosyltransferase
MLPFWAGIPERITSTSKFTGKTSHVFSFLNNHRLEYKQHTSKLKHNLEILKFLEIKDCSEKKEVFITEEEEQKTQKFLQNNNIKDDDLIVGVSVTAGNKTKEWELFKFEQLSDKLKKELNAKIIFIEQANFELHELAALLKKIKLFISVDTGPLYIAHAVGTLVVDITGPCDIDEQPPRDSNAKLVYKKIECWPCSFVVPPARYCKRKHLHCIKNISVNDVFGAVVELVKENHIL